MSRLIRKNFRYFFVNDIRDGAVGAGRNICITIGDHSVGWAEGVIGSVQHGNVVFCVAYAYEKLSAQVLLQLPGGIELGAALGMLCLGDGFCR